ncbi:hypothetical protein SLEP1_g3594 [Rubroshorea leprosula]|uniref:RRM domain-containing protein n=1 Tax=Rubroshorea leprosula TaxID=152421 RepID=A0AAV5HTI1_9ROSI|nr:hypothetical protein SLEP1_g3594 [Rubroshorea leprosula]
MLSQRVRARGAATGEASGTRQWQGNRHRIPRLDYKLLGQTKTFFFYNFPKNCEEKDLWYSFQRYGKVLDVNVPKKRDKWGRFGFLRMLRVQNENQMVKRLNDIWFRSYKLRVKIAEERRSMVAIVKSLTIINEIQQRIDVNGGMITLSPLGGRRVLLTERELGFLLEFMNLNKELFALWFEDIQSWDKEVQEESRIVWLCISGIPLKAWCDRYFKMIGELVGDVVEEKLYEIQVVEEEWCSDPDWWLSDDDRQRAFTDDGYLRITGEWGIHKVKCNLVNVYGPNDRQKRVKLWDELRNMITKERVRWLIVGEFSVVRCLEERRGRIRESPDMKDFDVFILSASLIDIKMVQQGLKRNISNHCAIVLKTRIADWGPKPFRVLDAWLLHLDFKKVIKEKWSAMEAVKQVEQVDMKNEEFDLDEFEILQRQEGFQKMWDIMRKREVTWKQKSRSN